MEKETYVKPMCDIVAVEYEIAKGTPITYSSTAENGYVNIEDLFGDDDDDEDEDF